MCMTRVSMFGGLAIVAICFVANLHQVLSLIDCLDVLNLSSFTGECNNKWSNIKSSIKPTQAEVGFAWIQYKLSRDFTSSSDAQEAMDEGPIPAIIGPGPAMYIVDDHHTLSALDYSGYSGTSVTFSIICDKRNLTEEEFWSTLKKQDLAYLVAHPYNQPDALPVTISYKSLPASFSFTSARKVFSDDPWRSLAGFSRKVQTAAKPAPACSSSDDKYCERCMFRGCVDGYKTSGPGVAYFEFRWAYFMNDATYFTPSLWPSDSDRKLFLGYYEALPQPSVMGKVDTDAWASTAEYIISLCRGSNAGSYQLDTSMYPGSASLPGYAEGYVSLPADPDCSLPVCV